MTEPTTAAGRALLAECEDMDWPTLPDVILAIEAEARASQAEYDFVSGPGIPPHQCAPLDVERLARLEAVAKAAEAEMAGRVPLNEYCSAAVWNLWDKLNRLAALEEPTDD